MSVVACKVYDDKIEIASDSITVRGYTQSKGDNVECSKLFRVNDLIIGSCGTAQEMTLLKIYSNTHKPSKSDEESFLAFLSEFSEWKNNRIKNSDIENSYIFLFEGKAFISDNFVVHEIKKYDAIGAGMTYALAAMYLDNDVKKSVETSCELSVWCEKPIVFYGIKK